MLIGLLLLGCTDGGAEDTGYDIAENPCATGLWPGDARLILHRFAVDDVDHVPSPTLACRTADATTLELSVSYGDGETGAIVLAVPALDTRWTLGEDAVTAQVTKGEQVWDTGHFATGGTVELESGFVDDVSGRVEGDAASDSGVLRLTLDLHVGSPAAWSGSATDSGLGGDTGGAFDSGGYTLE